MNTIIIPQKTGFYIIDPFNPVNIRDFRNKLFYSTEPLLPKVKNFNLPVGKYFVENGLIRVLKEPVKYPLLRMPKPERKLISPFDFEIIVKDNPNKCTINWNKKTITFDPEIMEKSLSEIYFILYHEYGHQLFNTEKYADLVACNYMLRKGFNPSQIASAPILSLSERAQERKEYIVNNFTNGNY